MVAFFEQCVDLKNELNKMSVLLFVCCKANYILSIYL